MKALDDKMLMSVNGGYSFDYIQTLGNIQLAQILAAINKAKGIYDANHPYG